MRKAIALLFLMSFCLCIPTAFAAPVDLSTFVATPADPGIVNIGAGAIAFHEDMNFGFIYAANDSLFVPTSAVSLTYNYALTPGDANDYDWLVALINSTYVMAIERSGSGSFSINMAPYQGQTISLAFGLEYDSINDMAFSSIGTISNVEFANPVPVPATILLFGSGIFGLIGINRKKRIEK